MKTASVQQPVTAWFRADQFHPALPGYYRARNNRPLPTRSRDRLAGGDLRYWDGSRWLTWERGEPSVFGRHDSHEWCGRRMWVLRGNELVGRAYFSHFLPRLRFNVNTNPMRARAFATEAQAAAYLKRFAARLPGGFVPVLA